MLGSDRQIVLEAIQALPADTSLEEIRDRIDLLVALRKAERTVDRRETVSQEEVESEFATWVETWRTQFSGPGTLSGI